MDADRKKGISPAQVAFWVLGVGILAQILSLIFSQGRFLENIVYDFSRFTDFFDHVRRFYLGLDLVYEEGMHACFPPLAYSVYYLISRVLYAENAQAPEDLAVSASGMLVICMLTALVALFFVFALERLLTGWKPAAEKKQPKKAATGKTVVLIVVVIYMALMFLLPLIGSILSAVIRFF